jgi:hypothetical protein
MASAVQALGNALGGPSPSIGCLVNPPVGIVLFLFFTISSLCNQK